MLKSVAEGVWVLQSEVQVPAGYLPVQMTVVRGDGGVLLLTDMFGGTPSNLGMTFIEQDQVEVITGVNLPMLIKLAGKTRSSDLLAVAQEMREHGRNAIWVASDLLRAEKTREKSGEKPGA